jgi:NADH:ubiquinone oxidoreductase subunit 4 (subunit M)
VLAL